MGIKTSPSLILPLQRRGRKREGKSSSRGVGEEKGRRYFPLQRRERKKREGGGKKREEGEGEKRNNNNQIVTKLVSNCN